jgi:hypothetical protein
MNLSFNKNLYSVIGVSPNASQKEIHDAYIACIRIIHPDRFDRHTQLRDWQKANEMLSELNVAYSILEDPVKRKEYDNFLKAELKESPVMHQHTESKYSRSSTSYNENYFKGSINFTDLTVSTKERLLKRQENKNQEQFQIKQQSISWNYIFFAFLIGWFCFLFVKMNGPIWNINGKIIFVLVSLLDGFLFARNIIFIIHWRKSSLKSFFYVTPIYFIKTRFDIISSWPIWTLKDFVVTHNLKNGSYENSDITLKFEGHSEYFTFYSKHDVDKYYNIIQSYKNQLKDEIEKGNYEYIRKHDDFQNITKGDNQIITNIPKKKRLLIYACSILTVIMLYLISLSINSHQRYRKWAHHEIKSTNLPSSTQSVTNPNIPEQFLPLNGSIINYSSKETIAPFEIKASEGNNYFMKLIDVNNGSTVMTIFIKSGNSVNIEVPLGRYEIKYASGLKWYGYEYLFGPDTRYSKANKIFEFEIKDNEVSGYSMTLYQVENGNLKTTSINVKDF